MTFSQLKIEMVYLYQLTRIEARLYRRLSLLWVAGKLIKLAFRISPDLEKQINKSLTREEW